MLYRYGDQQYFHGYTLWLSYSYFMKGTMSMCRVFCLKTAALLCVCIAYDISSCISHILEIPSKLWLMTYMSPCMHEWYMLWSHGSCPDFSNLVARALAEVTRLEVSFWRPWLFILIVRFFFWFFYLDFSACILMYDFWDYFTILVQELSYIQRYLSVCSKRSDHTWAAWGSVVFLLIYFVSLVFILNEW